MESNQESPIVQETTDIGISILNSIKKLLGISSDYNQFDQDIIIHINSVFTILTQLGIGPSDGFSIVDANDEWEDFMDENSSRLELVKSYIYLKVKLLFDPPQSTAAIESTNRMISEFEFRLQVIGDSITNTNE